MSRKAPGPEGRKGYKMTNELIEKLEGLGFSRWQKNGMDRLYVNASTLGLHCSYHKSGSISDATFRGKVISNSEARRIKGAKTYIDLNDNMIVSDNALLAQAVAEILGVEPENGWVKQIKIAER